ncbi:MAG: polysaccharide pyruvyl transferase family protein, partial [Thermodesulfobacteriota bacterium]|nr:polysaccharide pyruvyl transferase family protein [Thermodesulfobacteriota bacterium]
MNILITGHDAFHNKGCQALIYTTTKILKQTFPGTSFTIFSWEPEYDSNHFYNDNIESQFIRHRYKTGEFSHRNRFWYFLNYYLGMKTDRFIWVNSSFYESIKRSDLLVVSGGDVLGDYGDNAIKHYFFPIAVAIALRKPVYVFA